MSNPSPIRQGLRRLIIVFLISLILVWVGSEVSFYFLKESSDRAPETIELVIPDGAGIVLYLQLQGKRQQRCPGIELAASLLQQAGELGESCPVFFYGGAPGVAEKAVKLWQEQLPKLAIAGIGDGYLSPEAEAQLKALRSIERTKRITHQLISIIRKTDPMITEIDLISMVLGLQPCLRLLQNRAVHT